MRGTILVLLVLVSCTSAGKGCPPDWWDTPCPTEDDPYDASTDEEEPEVPQVITTTAGPEHVPMDATTAVPAQEESVGEQVDDGEPVGFPLWHEDTVLTCTCPQDTHISMISCLMLTYNSVDFETAVAVAASMRARWNGFFSYRLVCSSFHLHPDHILSAFPSERVCGEGKCSFGLEKCHCPPLLPSYAIVAAHLSAVRHLSATRLLSLGLNTPKESYDEVCCIRGLCWDWEGVGHTSRLLVRVHWRGYAPCQVVPLSVDLVVSEPFHVFVIAVFAGGFYVHPSIRRALERWLVDFGGSGEDAK